MSKLSLFSRRWSRRGCALFLASLAVPGSLVADADNVPISRVPPVVSEKPASAFDELFPYIGIRFSERAETAKRIRIQLQGDAHERSVLDFSDANETRPPLAKLPGPVELASPENQAVASRDAENRDLGFNEVRRTPPINPVAIPDLPITSEAPSHLRDFGFTEKTAKTPQSKSKLSEIAGFDTSRDAARELFPTTDSQQPYGAGLNVDGPTGVDEFGHINTPGQGSGSTDSSSSPERPSFLTNRPIEAWASTADDAYSSAQDMLRSGKASIDQDLHADGRSTSTDSGFTPNTSNAELAESDFSEDSESNIILPLRQSIASLDKARQRMQPNDNDSVFSAEDGTRIDPFQELAAAATARTEEVIPDATFDANQLALADEHLEIDHPDTATDELGLPDHPAEEQEQVTIAQPADLDWPNEDSFNVPSIMRAVDDEKNKSTPIKQEALEPVTPAKAAPQPDPSVLPIEAAPNDRGPTSRSVESHARNEGRATGRGNRPVEIRESIAGQAREYINKGMSLAQRNAIYSSRAQFIKALRLVSQALDIESGSNRHSAALASGLRALEEAKHLRPSGSRLEGNISLDRILMAHQTPVLQGRDLSRVSPIEAVQAYHAHAEQQLAIAGGRELAAADALFGLAKLQPHLDLSNDDQMQVGPIAMSYFQSALMVYPNHFLAANELGVMFARFGQLQDAREVLRFGAAAAPNYPDIWRNLAQVHRRLGEEELAQLAAEEYQALRPSTLDQSSIASRLQIQWVEPSEFSKDTAGQTDDQSSFEGQVRAQRPTTNDRRSAQQQQSPPQSNWPFR